MAAILVVVFHHMNTLREGIAPTLPRFDAGASGVDIFFVISGFIMWTTTAGQPPTGAAFMKRRLVRIVPLYWTLTLITVFVTTSGGISLNFDTDYPRLLKSLFFVPQRNAQYPIVAPCMIAGWTLELEIFFYAIFSAVLWLPPVKRIASVLAALSALTLAGLLVSSSVPLFKAYTNDIVLEFGIGLVLGRLHELGFVRQAGKLGLGLLALGALLASMREHLPGIRCVYFGLPALSFVAGSLHLEAWLQGQFWRFPKLLGDASYSIYLAQMMAMAVSAKLLARWSHAPAPLKALLFQICFAIVAGCLVYFCLERPLGEAAHKLLAWQFRRRVDTRL